MRPRPRGIKTNQHRALLALPGSPWAEWAILDYFRDIRKKKGSRYRAASLGLTFARKKVIWSKVSRAYTLINRDCVEMEKKGKGGAGLLLQWVALECPRPIEGVREPEDTSANVYVSGIR